MNVDDIVKQEEATLLRTLCRYHEELEMLDSVRPILEQLPEPDSVYVGIRQVEVSYFAPPDRDVGDLRSEIQAVLHVHATRELAEYAGEVFFQFRVPNLLVKLNGASLAPGCELVREDYTATRFKVVCQ